MTTNPSPTASPRGQRSWSVMWRLIRRELADHRLRTLLTVILVAIPVWVVTHHAVTALDNVQTTEKLLPFTVGAAAAFVAPLEASSFEAPVACRQRNSLVGPDKGCVGDHTAKKLPERGDLSALAPAGTRLLPRYWSDVRGLKCRGRVGSSTRVEEPGNWTLRVIPRHTPPTDVPLGEGRLPNSDGEIAVGNVCALAGVKVGDVVSGGGASWTVVGIADGSDVTVPEGHALASTAGDLPRYTTWQLFTGHQFTEADVEAFNAQGWFLAAPTLTASEAWITTAERDAWNEWAMSALNMGIGSVVLASLVAVGFVLAARQRRHQMTLLSATGASNRDLVTLTVAHGLLVGGMGVATGVLLGLASGIALMALSAEPIEVPWLRVLGFAAIAWLVSGLAALAPAWGVAAAGGSGEKRPRRLPWLSLLHSAVVVAGWVALPIVMMSVDAWPRLLRYRQETPWWLILWAAVLVSSVLAAVASMPRVWLWALDHLSSRGSVWWRLGVREMSRHRVRTWAALAATLCLGGSYWPLLVIGMEQSSPGPGFRDFVIIAVGLAVLTAVAVGAVTVMTFTAANTDHDALAAAGVRPVDALRRSFLVAMTPVIVGCLPALLLVGAAAWAMWTSVGVGSPLVWLVPALSMFAAVLVVISALVTAWWREHRRGRRISDAGATATSGERTPVS